MDYSKFQAYEIFGPGVSALLLLSNLATVAGLVVIIALYGRAFRNPQPTPVAIGLVVLATVAIMTITNKTLSPQYLLWLGGPMAALLILRGQATEQEKPRSAGSRSNSCCLAALTQLVYPLLYDGLLGRERQGDDRHLHLRHHRPQSRTGRLHRRGLPVGLARLLARADQRVSSSPAR